MKQNNFNKYLSGEKLYGDDFSEKEIKEWFDDEKEGYSSLNSSYEEEYGYKEVNKINGYKFLRKIKVFNNVLGFGAADGKEFFPILNKIKNITIIEPSQKLRAKNLNGKKINYVTPEISGKISFENNKFDLITCFGVLHHIPNVTFVLSEFSRTLKKDGYLLIREPIVSMGDWRQKRIGVTKRERGIPLQYFRKIIKNNNLEIVSEKLILFPFLRRINFRKYRGGNSRFWVYLDIILGKIFSFNYRYHSTKSYHKITPQSVFYVLRKKSN